MTPTRQQPCGPTNLSRIPRAIDNGSLIIQDMLGVGAYGSVHRALDIHTGAMRAVKCLCSTGLNDQQRTFQRQEVELHARVSGHPNIATLHKVVEENDECLYMVMDCGAEGDLFYKITERGGFVGNDKAIKSIFGQIVDAVMHCHAKGVYHRDLKPENIILFGDSAKLVDFGLATTEPISTDFGCGSTFYLSPECQGGYVETAKSYDSALNDVWSLGVILINLVFGRNPWKQACTRDETFSAYVVNNDFLRTILPMSSEFNEIIKAVFCLNPRKRITLPELARRVQACHSLTTTTTVISMPSPAGVMAQAQAPLAAVSAEKA
ncbi:hypothetical protein BGZ99_002442 [Dissophora globulifera]|uniref:Protein kinase domain-containing protein n=1 Tax=Dissophora globulifera TaxID=979702 RepID=A0A9P6RSD1_9FUNG|nr:hypothetical protein BGZ99_002442 [Dissophora globulifera]